MVILCNILMTTRIMTDLWRASVIQIYADCHQLFHIDMDMLGEGTGTVPAPSDSGNVGGAIYFFGLASQLFMRLPHPLHESVHDRLQDPKPISKGYSVLIRYVSRGLINGTREN